MDNDLIKMRIVSIIIILFFLIYTRLWLGDFFKYHRNPDSYTIYDAYITEIIYLGKTDSSIKYSYYFEGIKLENEGSKRGNKLYEKICMEQYKSEYIKKIEFENYMGVRQRAIMDYFMNEKKIDKPIMNQASNWYKEQKYDFRDVILHDKDCFLRETKKARECGMPEDYYVIAVKDTHWLCCHAEEKCIYAFSKALGLTHTKYQSLYDYIIDICNIPFDIEKDS